MRKFSREIEVRGHLIDSLVLTKIFDSIMDLDGKFEVLDIDVGKKKTDESYAKLLVQGKNKNNLEEILEIIYRLGATARLQKSIKLKPATKNMVMPDNFYSTTNNHTVIYYKNKWIDVKNMMMDKGIVIKGNKARCVPIREIRKGDIVVVGEDGIKVSWYSNPGVLKNS